MGQLIDLYNSISSDEGGKAKFAELVCQMAPYFSTIYPEVIELRPGYSEWSMKKRREVENHLSTVHAIAVCNLCEITAGLCMEASIPENKRWIPTGLNIKYLHKAKTDLRAICVLENVDWANEQDLDLEVVVLDTDNKEVAIAIVPMRIGDK